MRCLLLLYAILSFLDCSAAETSFFTYMDPISNRYSNDVQRRRGFECLGGGGGGCGEFRRISLMFKANITASVMDARRIIVNEALRLVPMLNADRKLRPYMHDFPSGPQNLVYSLIFRNSNEPPRGDSMVGIVHLKNGKIAYESTGVGASCSVLLHSETFEQALEALKADAYQKN